VAYAFAGRFGCKIATSGEKGDAAATERSWALVPGAEQREDGPDAFPPEKPPLALPEIVTMFNLSSPPGPRCSWRTACLKSVGEVPGNAAASPCLPGPWTRHFVPPFLSRSPQHRHCQIT
jgi:hypothetical protein